MLSIRIELDVSNGTLAGILSLKWEDGWYLVIYCSKKFSRAKVYYLIYDKELFAIVRSFKEWRYYLKGAPRIKV